MDQDARTRAAYAADRYDEAAQAWADGDINRMTAALRFAEVNAAVAQAQAAVDLVDAIRQLTSTVDPDRGG